ncbi:MAG: nucleoside triphosphate pyrophosphohydrolase [Candidatus Binatus sp.]|uniref:nucleoside triphosphate pyrophosphohydrolase n=1 Tax=Candidatus Binatus sp. TaxID=2811406 RepID=UPI00271630F6|nr:nucleoside triphosphate pyrophosphohydrolase [Candidatus Binatus sp.]MDO8433938.1 nucleoside triphosphate pyrophosphohydrolase [Candidatus Binatus sp.]
MSDNDAASAFAKLLTVVTELRERCPWDREQKLADTPRHLIEEAYEVSDAIARGDSPEVAEELGDLIVQSLFVGIILAEQNQFDLAGVLEDASKKLVRRHPHVYGDTRADTVDQVIENWERIKQSEREKKTQDAKSIAHVGRALPALMRAEKLGEKARRAGMDWANLREVLAKVREEIAEIEHALDIGNLDAAGEEIGDLMLAVANAPRFVGRNAEQTLRAACDKFVGRFDALAKSAAERGLDLKQMPPEAIESLWQELKKPR